MAGSRRETKPGPAHSCCFRTNHDGRACTGNFPAYGVCDSHNRQLRALLLRIERSALFGQVVLNSLFHGLEGVWIGLPVVTGEELDGPLVDEFFGGQFFPQHLVSRVSR